MLEIITLIAPIFLLLAVGALLRASGAADEQWVDVLNRYGLYVAFPALVLDSLLNLDRAELSEKLYLYLLNAILLASVIAALVAVVKLFKVRKSLANTYVICGFFGNIAYLGYPVISSVYSDVQGELSIVISQYVFLLFTFGIVFLEASKERRLRFSAVIANIIKNPFMMAIFLGIFLTALRVRIPVYLQQALSMLKASASPVVIVALGIFISRRIKLSEIYAHTLAITFLRLLVCPALFYAAGRAMRLLPAFSVPVIEAGMPLGVTTFALSADYPLEKEIIVSAIVLSTLLSVFTLPVLIAFAGQ